MKVINGPKLYVCSWFHSQTLEPAKEPVSTVGMKCSTVDLKATWVRSLLAPKAKGGNSVSALILGTIVLVVQSSYVPYNITPPNLGMIFPVCRIANGNCGR
jgi:hypothetical protein